MSAAIERQTRHIIEAVDRAMANAFQLGVLSGIYRAHDRDKDADAATSTAASNKVVDKSRLAESLDELVEVIREERPPRVTVTDAGEGRAIPYGTREGRWLPFEPPEDTDEDASPELKLSDLGKGDRILVHELTRPTGTLPAVATHDGDTTLRWEFENRVADTSHFANDAEILRWELVSRGEENE